MMQASAAAIAAASDVEREQAIEACQQATRLSESADEVAANAEGRAARFTKPVAEQARVAAAQWPADGGAAADQTAAPKFVGAAVTNLHLDSRAAGLGPSQIWAQGVPDEKLTVDALLVATMMREHGASDKRAATWCAKASFPRDSTGVDATAGRKYYNSNTSSISEAHGPP